MTKVSVLNINKMWPIGAVGINPLYDIFYIRLSAKHFYRDGLTSPLSDNKHIVTIQFMLDVGLVSQNISIITC